MTLDEQIADFAPAPELAALLREVVASRSVETAREATYISVRPPGRAIAAYVNRQHVDIAVAPETSRAAEIRVGATRVLRRSTTTNYVRAATSAFDPAAVLAEVISAVDWREQGPRWSGEVSGGAYRDLVGEICGSCFTQITPSGACNCD